MNLVALLVLAVQTDVGPSLETIRKKHDLPALAAVVIRGRETVLTGATGVRKRGSDRTIALTDRFHLGSCTKAMTATLIARLVEQKKLSWATAVGDVYPELEMNVAWKTVTLEQLLINRGGAPHAFAPELFGALRRHEGTPVEQRRALVEGVLAGAPAAPPGTKYIYSNAGFCIAGAMAEAKLGTPWEELMKREVFGPLGMKSAGFGAPDGDEPRGHRADGTPAGTGRMADNPPSLGPAGRVHATLGDWARFVGFHLRGDASYLKPETLARLHRPAGEVDDRYAMGWVVAERPWGGGQVLTHSGSNTMWYCVTWVAPRKGFAVLVATNQGGDKAFEGCDAAASLLIRRILGR